MAVQEVQEWEIQKVNTSGNEGITDMLAVEEPLEIRIIHGVGRYTKSIAVTMRTPANDEELAVGFLFTEGIIKQKADILSCEVVKENVVVVELSPAVKVNLKEIERNFYTTSSCGVCGKSSIEAIYTSCNLYDKAAPFTVSADLLYSLPEKLSEWQTNFRHTGGIHATALFSTGGELMEVREDVGRHNAFDKLAGVMLLQERLPISNHIVLLSGRASFELVQKAAMAGVKLLVAVGAPSSLAVATADELGMTLAGFLRENRFNIYCGKERIIY